jgi:hypothetical protein
MGRRSFARMRRPAGHMTRFVVMIAVTTVLGTSACGASADKGDHTPVLTVSGRIGVLRVDVSERREVVAFAGRPDAERRGRNTVASPSGSARYDALGYRCGRDAGPGALPLVQGGGSRPSPKCRTVFFIETRSGRLGLFYTSDPRYREGHGVRVGMRTAEAERLLGRRLRAGCEANIYLSSPKATLTVAFTGGLTHRDGTVTGGRVYALVLHGDRHDPGVFECM